MKDQPQHPLQTLKCKHSKHEYKNPFGSISLDDWVGGGNEVQINRAECCRDDIRYDEDKSWDDHEKQWTPSTIYDADFVFARGKKLSAIEVLVQDQSTNKPAAEENDKKVVDTLFKR